MIWLLGRTKPAAIAATMPHRRALGEKAVDQLAESELGRLALRGEFEPVLATATSLAQELLK